MILQVGGLDFELLRVSWGTLAGRERGITRSGWVERSYVSGATPQSFDQHIFVFGNFAYLANG